MSLSKNCLREVQIGGVIVSVLDSATLNQVIFPNICFKLTFLVILVDTHPDI